MIKIKEDTINTIKKAIKANKKLPVRIIDLYKESMPFSRRSFLRGIIQLADDGFISIEKKSYGRGLGVFISIIQVRGDLNGYKKDS